MNPRIRELAKEALDYAEKNQSAEVQQHWFKSYNEKFAELIIRECAFVAQNKDDTNIDLRYGRGLAAGKIFEHFGY